MGNTKDAKIICIGFWGCIITFMLASLAVLMTRQILVKRFHVSNEIVKFIYSGNATLIEEAERYRGKASDPIDWEKKYPHAMSVKTDENNNSQTERGEDERTTVEKYLAVVNSIKSNISNYVEKYQPWKTYMNWISGDYNLITMGRETALARDNLYIAHDEWIYSYYPGNNGGDEPCSEEDIDELADTVEDFYEFLRRRNIGFIYASVSSKPCPYDEETVSYNVADNETSKRARFLRALDKRNVPECNLSEMMPLDPGNWYELYYKTDPHWNDLGGMWASGVLAQYLNDNCGFNFDPDMFGTNMYIEDTRDDYFRGQTARQVSPSMIRKESLTRFIPRFETRYKVKHFSERRTEERYGDLIDVFFNNDVYDSLGTLSEREIYDGTQGDHRFIINDDLYTIENEASPDNKDKRILIIRDSFATYFAPYFSTDVGRVDLIYMPKFTGSIRRYIEDTKPDAVIMLLLESNITPIAESNDSQGFHFDLQ